MGELIFIKDGYATTIHEDGNITVVASQYCDQCKSWQTGLGGFNVRDVSGESVMWLCAECRA